VSFQNGKAGVDRIKTMLFYSIQAAKIMEITGENLDQEGRAGRLIHELKLAMNKSQNLSDDSEWMHR
jgi:hypothetical protein